MESSPRSWLRQLLRSVIDFALRHSLSYQEFISISRDIYVERARAQLAKDTQKINASRIAALTGLHRRDIKATLDQDWDEAESVLSIPQRVLNRWEQDRRFTTKAKKPRVLDFEGIDSEFHHLVRSISACLNPGTILFELERIGAVERSPKGLKMLEDFHRFGADPAKAFDIVGNDFSTILAAVEENVFRRKKLTNVHLRTEYSNIYKKDLPKVRRWLLKEARDFHRRTRFFLSEHDKDLSPRARDDEAGHTVALGSFSLTDDF